MRLDERVRLMPAIIVTTTDQERLAALASAVMKREPAVAHELLAELDRAIVVAADAAPRTLVRMGSTLTFRSDDGVARQVTLVFPGEADIGRGRISILTPVGTALLGLSKGASIKWQGRDGRERELTVIDVNRDDGSISTDVCGA
jgi:regulator of nucleoside diphosphate kinase